MNKSRLSLLLLVCLLMTIILSIVLGSVKIPIKDIWTIVINTFTTDSTASTTLQTSASILFKLRLPRTLLVLLVGAALAASGGAYQGLFRNPLADPYLIGVASGAGLGSIAALTINWPQNQISYFLVPISAFLGAVLMVALVYSIASVKKGMNTTTLILAGVALGSFANALTSFLLINAGGELRRAVVWMMGGSTLIGWQPLIAMSPYVLAGITALSFLGYRMNVLQFGDEKAQQMGVDVKRLRLLIIITASLTTAAAVAFAGTIAFVGLIVPHIIRGLIGKDYRWILPLSALGGAIFLLAADIISRILIPPQEIPVGIITTLFGAPFFLYILSTSRKRMW